ncbi:MAG: BLUF domain-containing protein [Myxococcota bacterium]
MYQLLYLSRAQAMTPAELHTLGTRCAANNRAAGVTGLIIHWNGCFLQLLEGEDAAVEQIFFRVTQDSRHREVSVLDTGIIPARRFDSGATTLVDLENPPPEMTPILARHPALSMMDPHYRDPMLAFVLLFDVHHCLQGGRLAA